MKNVKYLLNFNGVHFEVLEKDVPEIKSASISAASVFESYMWFYYK